MVCAFEKYLHSLQGPVICKKEKMFILILFWLNVQDRKRASDCAKMQTRIKKTNSFNDVKYSKQSYPQKYSSHRK